MANEKYAKIAAAVSGRPFVPEAAGDVPAGASEPVIRVEGLRKSFGDHVVLRDIDLTVNPGQVVTIIGASGSGKSTLLRCLNLLETPDAGHVWFRGKDLAADHVDVNRLREKIGMVFQGFNLFNNMDVLDNCTLAPVTLKKMTKPEAEKVALRHLDAVGLADFAHANVTRLSGGQKQRVAIAGVVAMRPDCLILDEATAMLDPRGREQVMQTIHYLNRNMGITVVSITHYMEEAAQADRVLVMSKGHVVMEGTPKEVFSQTEKVRSLHLDVPQAAELRDELVKAGIPMPEGIIDTGECAQALYELLQ